jgi:hypothetical protein
MKNLLTLLFSAYICSSFAQEGSEIYLFDLKIKKDEISVSNPVNITNHKGYDNQPFIHPTQPVIYYASFNDDGRSDIKSYNYKTKETVSITQTQEREYSPTLTPDQQSLSCIIQRDNDAQDLGKYPLAGGDPSVIIDNMIVGYHVWADNSHLAMFVLGTPNTLHYLRLPTKEDTVIAQNIGRSLHKIPGQSAISFVHKVSDTEWAIKKLDSRTMAVSTITAPLPTVEKDLTWTSDGKIIMSQGEKLFFCNPKKSKEWRPVQIKSGTEVLKKITRLAASADGKKLAVVVSED